MKILVNYRDYILKLLFTLAVSLLLAFMSSPVQFVAADSPHMNHTNHSPVVCVSLCSTPTRHDEHLKITDKKDENEVNEKQRFFHIVISPVLKIVKANNEHWVDKTPKYIKVGALLI